jgi:hypothetical protein
MLSSVVEPELEQNKCFLFVIHKIKGMVEDEILMLECLKTTFRRNISSNLKEINKSMYLFLLTAL